MLIFKVDKKVADTGEKWMEKDQRTRNLKWVGERLSLLYNDDRY